MAGKRGMRRTAICKIIHDHLLAHADQSGQVAVKQTEMSVELDIDRSTFWKGLKALIDHGLLEEGKRWGGSRRHWTYIVRSGDASAIPIDRPSRKRISGSLRWAVWERDDFRCRRCGRRQFLEVDHILPESRGGETVLDNLQTLCHDCNIKKSARPDHPTLFGTMDF